jgi:hypothetical protein
VERFPGLGAVYEDVLRTARRAFDTRGKPVGGVVLSAPATPAEVGKRIAAEEERWNALVKKAEIQLE